MYRTQKKLGEILAEKGLITDEQLQAALEEQKQTKEFLGKILLKRNFIKERDLLAALGEQFGLPLGSLRNKYLDWKFVKNFSVSLILDYRYFPISADDYSVTMATVNPLDVWAMKKAEDEAGGRRLKMVLVPEEDMDEAIHRYRQYLKANY